MCVSLDDDLIGKIVNAITASVQPKECSVNALKSYVVEFYPQFQVKDRPFLLRKALERAVQKDLIRCVSRCHKCHCGFDDNLL